MSRVPIIYILSVGRSGSTLLELLLARRRGVAGIGEFHRFTDFIEADALCACGVPVRQCDLWTRVLDLVPSANTEGVSFHTDAFGLGLIRLLRAYFHCLFGRPLGVRHRETACLNARLLSATLEATDCAYIVDSSKNLGRLCAMHQSGLFDLRVVHLVRDGRGVAYSQCKPKIKSAAQHPAWTVPRSFAWAVRRWIVLNVLGMLLGSTRLRGRYVRLRYEDLAADPGGMVDAVLAAAGIRDTPPLGIDASPMPISHAIGGNSMRQRPLRAIQVDDEWRHRIGRKDRVVSELLGIRVVNWLVHRNSVQAASHIDDQGTANAGGRN